MEFFKKNLVVSLERLLAYCVDSVLILVILFVSVVVLSAIFPSSLVYVVSFSIFLFYYIFFIGKYGQTFGKKLVGLKVVDSENNVIGYKKAFYRFMLQYLSTVIFCIGHIYMLFNEQNLAMQDKFLNTRVIKIN